MRISIACYLINLGVMMYFYICQTSSRHPMRLTDAAVVALIFLFLTLPIGLLANELFWTARR
jgi:hypothetical protein